MYIKPNLVISAASATLLIIAMSATSVSSGQSGALVRLQSSTPGVAQTGHSNVTGTVRAGQLVGAGSGITALNAANLASGTVPDSRLSGTYAGVLTFSNANNAYSGNGSGLTGLNASNLSSGTLASGRLSGLYSNALTFSNASNAFTGNGSGLTNVNAAQLGGLASSAFAQLGGTNTWTGANTFGNAGNSFSGSGSGLTSLNASNLASGIVPGARIGGIYANAVSFTNINNTFTGSAVGLVDLNANNMTAGTLLNGRLSGTYTNALTFNNASNSFSGNGANLTNVNAALLDGVDSTAFLQSVPNPLILSGNTNAGVVQINGTTNGDFGQALQVNLSGDASFSSAIYSRMTTTNSTNAAIQADMFGSGMALFAGAAGPSSVGVSAYTDSATGIGIVAANLAGGLAFVSENKSSLRGNVGIAGSQDPIFPIDFNENLGDKISLWGTDPTSHYGFGIQAGRLQMFTSTVGDVISFGYGGSTALNETVRIINLNCELRLRPSGGDFSSRMTTPYDLLVEHDFDNNSTDSWIRIHTNSYSIEQVRIQDGDEAATLFDGAVTANGIDFAEGFKVHDETLEPGDLVVNYGQDWEYIARSHKAYDSAVIGVISTKPAFIAGMSFNAEDGMDAELTKRRDAARKAGDHALEKLLTKQMREMMLRRYRPVAFMGRVPVKVTGVVRPGDHLAASNVAGTAMAMNRAGHSIGIALEGNSGGNGKIMVMIQPRFFNGLEVPNNPDTKIESLEATVKQLQSENAELRNRLDRLEQMMMKR